MAPVCQRCHSLRHHGIVTPLKVPYEEVKEHLKLISDQSCLVVKIVDIFDFSGSFINDFRGITGNNPVVLVGNKVPILFIFLFLLFIVIILSYYSYLLYIDLLTV